VSVKLVGLWVSEDRGVLRLTATHPVSSLAGSARTERSRAQLWISHRRRWMSVELELDLTARGPTIQLSGPTLQGVRDADGAAEPNGLRLVDARLASDGRWREVTLQATSGSLLLPVPPGRSRVRLRYEGPTFNEDADARPGLTEIGGWAFRAGWPNLHPVEVIIHVDSAEQVLSSMPLERIGQSEGWTTWRGAATDMAVPHLVVGPESSTPAERVIEVSDGAGNRLRLHDTAAFCSREVEPILAAMGAIMPLGSHEVHAVALAENLAGKHAGQLVLLQPRVFAQLCLDPRDDDPRLTFAHELAHRWFGEQIVNVDHYASSWTESLAEYASTTVVSRAGRHRCGRSDGYARKAAGDRLSMTAWRDELWEVRSYGRGLLLLTALEHRVGRPALVEVMRRLVRERIGQVGSWADVVDAVAAEAGQEHADWLQTWLDRPGAPDLRLVAKERRADRLGVELVQSEPTWVGAVEVSFVDGEEVLGSHWLDFSAARTSFELPVPAGARELVLDRDCRLPRAYDPSQTALASGRALALDVP
jgi:hypothetical protein